MPQRLAEGNTRRLRIVSTAVRHGFLALALLAASAMGSAAAGGATLFGTDVGYMGDYDPFDEYTLMARAGMSARTFSRR